MTPSRVAMHTNSKVMSRVASGLLSSANANNPSRTTSLGSGLPWSGECAHYSLSLRNRVRRSLLIAHCMTRAAHPTFRRHDVLTRYQVWVGVINNHAHRWWFFTSRLWHHDCIILRIRLIRLLLSNHYIRLRCNPAKGHLTDIHVPLAQEGVLLHD
jgi:hypothetical protein